MTIRILPPLLVAAMVAALLVSPHAASADDSAKGVLETSSGIYQFTPNVCAIYSEDGIDDIEIGGPGTAPDGEDIYFELSSTANELSLGLGVNSAFAHAERSLKAGRYVSKEFTLAVMNRQISADDLVLIDENGTIIDDGASLTIDCGG